MGHLQGRELERHIQKEKCQTQPVFCSPAGRARSWRRTEPTEAQKRRHCTDWVGIRYPGASLSPHIEENVRNTSAEHCKCLLPVSDVAIWITQPCNSKGESHQPFRNMQNLTWPVNPHQAHRLLGRPCFIYIINPKWKSRLISWILSLPQIQDFYVLA